MGLRTELLAAATAAVAVPLGAAVAPAQAQPITGLYIGGGGGLNFLQTTDADARNGISGEVEFDLGAAGLLNLGWGFGNGLRAEIEGNYRWNAIDSARSAALGPLTLFRGSQQSWAVMTNLIYDFQAFSSTPITPYLGAGIGYAWTQAHKARATTTALGLDNVRIAADDWDGNFAYQAIAGLAFNLPMPGLAVTAEYRFFGTLSPEYEVKIHNLAGRAPVGRTTVETDNFNHSLLVGLRYAFNAPRPAPAPTAPAAPPAVQAQTFMVFFDWDRADLTARARETIGQAAQASRTQQTTRLEVAGHADRSGPAAYNQRLSQRRADNVAAELVRQGVPREAIVVSAYGETRPLVPTADGVREPQNRRVEIVLR
jgi:OmpA-OmpF porin, OOP family